MAQATLNHVLEQIKMLEPDELRQVDQAIKQQLKPMTDAEKRVAVHQALLTSGLVKKIKTLPANLPEAPAVPIQGKPLSETIIEERR